MLVCKAGFHLHNGKGIHSNVHHNGGAYVNKCMDMHSTINTVQTIYWGELMSYATCGTCMGGQMSIPRFHSVKKLHSEVQEGCHPLAGSTPLFWSWTWLTWLCMHAHDHNSIILWFPSANCLCIILIYNQKCNSVYTKGQMGFSYHAHSKHVWLVLDVHYI